MQEWINGQTDSWDPANVLEQYKTGEITEAELLGLHTPSFESELQVPGDVEAEKTRVLGKNTPVSFSPASRQDPDPRVPNKGTVQVPARRNLEFGPWNQAPFQEMENFR